ncbi:MAG TPA: DSD1 family PLP-dependent enzyme [Usitatibacteraceae bacterium]|nr:DSD1 family PLP-dependent enzyme [Usitatibacteraceae bacterium]
MRLSDLETPCLVLDAGRMEANVARLKAHLADLGGHLRPHVKTCKSIEVARGLMETPTGPITVSTLKEAEQFLDHGVTDILYAVGIAPGKLDHVLALRKRGADLAVVVDSVEAAQAVAARNARIPVLIEVDCDGHRAGVKPGDPVLVEIAKALARGAQPRGVMTHAGDSYNCRSTEAIAAMAEKERVAVLGSAMVLRSAGFASPVVSVGSTPTATFARSLAGVTEVRAGVFVFHDLVMAGLGVCRIEDIALSVLATVIGHQREKGWVITDGGWMAMSRDRGTARQPMDQGYGLVCDEAGRPLGDLVVSDANQEHGIVSRRGGGPVDVSRYPVGTRLRILPNHACATGAQHDAYHVVRGGTEVVARWPRFSGW